MAYTEVSASLFPLYVNTGSTVSPTWTLVDGINSLTHTPIVKTANASTFANANYEKEVPTVRGNTFKASGLLYLDENGTQDPGQVACQTLGAAVGSDAVGDFKILLPTSGDYLRFSGTVTVTQFGGSYDALAQWDVEIKTTAEPTLVPAGS